MSTPHGHGSGRATAVTGARPVVLLRGRPGPAGTGETVRVVHLAPLPGDGSGAITALCGALLSPEEYEAVPAGQGMPCDGCIVSHLATSNPPPTDSAAPSIAASAALSTAPAPEPTRPGTAPSAAARGYRAWGWPVALRRSQIWLTLGHDVVAVLMPMQLATEVTAILARRHCSPPVLAHPYAPDHRVLLGGEPFGVALPWPSGMHQVGGTVLLPPTLTPRGPLVWMQPPGPNALRGCREIDIATAVQSI